MQWFAQLSKQTPPPPKIFNDDVHGKESECLLKVLELDVRRLMRELISCPHLHRWFKEPEGG